MPRVTKQASQHKMGKRCGYTEHENGDIDVAPVYRDRMREIVIEADALISTQKVMLAHFVSMQKNIEAAKKQFWQDLDEDYALDKENYEYSLNFETGKMVRKKRPEPDDAKR